ncbi:MAG: hypothetical protein V3V67_12875 [Myxococcota bacterium]
MTTASAAVAVVLGVTLAAPATTVPPERRTPQTPEILDAYTREMQPSEPPMPCVRYE